MRSGGPVASATWTCRQRPNGCGRRSPRRAACTRCELLAHLAADFAAAVLGGMDVDVPAAAHEVCGLRVGERGGAFGRARRIVSDQNRDAGVLAGFGRAVEMGGRRRAAEP